MSHYVFGTSLSYSDYLQARSFTDSISVEVGKLVSTADDLRESAIEVVRETSDGITFSLQDVSSQISELDATFSWGFSEVLFELGEMKRSLEELVEIARTPAQTWAYEQYEIAREAVRKNLYPEALEYLLRAIEGHGGQTGFKIEYRFHHLRGTLRLGSFANSDPEVVDLAEAERSFRLAARYAIADYPKEAARSFVAAGWAAYCQGASDRAIEATDQALALSRGLGEGLFQRAKILMHEDRPSEGCASLGKAIGVDPRYALKAGADGDFKRYESQVTDLLDTLRDATRFQAESGIEKMEQRISKLRQLTVGGYRATELAEISGVEKAIESALSLANRNTLLGCLSAIDQVKVAERESVGVLRSIPQNALDRLGRATRELDTAERQAEKAGAKGGKIVGLAAVVVAGGFLASDLDTSLLRQVWLWSRWSPSLIEVLFSSVFLVASFSIAWLCGYLFFGGSRAGTLEARKKRLVRQAEEVRRLATEPAAMLDEVDGS